MTGVQTCALPISLAGDVGGPTHYLVYISNRSLYSTGGTTESAQLSSGVGTLTRRWYGLLIDMLNARGIAQNGVVPRILLVNTDWGVSSGVRDAETIYTTRATEYLRLSRERPNVSFDNLWARFGTPGATTNSWWAPTDGVHFIFRTAYAVAHSIVAAGRASVDAPGLVPIRNRPFR